MDCMICENSRHRYLPDAAGGKRRASGVFVYGFMNPYIFLLYGAKIYWVGQSFYWVGHHSYFFFGTLQKKFIPALTQESR